VSEGIFYILSVWGLQPPPLHVSGHLRFSCRAAGVHDESDVIFGWRGERNTPALVAVAESHLTPNRRVKEHTP
jgi:hypothetical protein